MHHPTRHRAPVRFARAATAACFVLGLAACGGGRDEADDDAASGALAATAADTARASAQARTRPAPPPPPSSDSTLALASASAAGKAATGDTCGVSADGGKVAFTSRANGLVADDANGLADLFLKDFNGNGITRVVTASSTTGIACLALTPDARTVVYVDDAPSGSVNVLGFGATERAIMVKNLVTGTRTRVTPLLSSLATTAGFSFAGVSDDGLRVAFIAQPTMRCSGYDCTANGPARMLMRDLSTGALVNLESQVRLTTTQGFADGEALLSPDGRRLAFSTRAPYPEAGDANTRSDVFVFEIASGQVRQVNVDAAGTRLGVPGFVGDGPTWGVQAFLVGSSRVAFYSDNDTDIGAGGVYVKDLATGSLDRVLGRVTNTVGYHAALSFSDDGRKVAYVEQAGGGLTATELPRVLDLATGARVNAATLSNGVAGNGNVTTNVLLSRDGRAVAFSNNSTNLLGGTSALGGAELRAYRKLLP